MKTIKLTKKQIKIISHALGEYEQFLSSCEDYQIILNHDKSPSRLFKSIDNIWQKLRK